MFRSPSRRVRAASSSVEEQKALERARHARRGLTISQMRLVFQIIEGNVTSAWEQRASNAQKVDLGLLLRAGYVVKRARHYVLSADVAFSLGLDPQGRRALPRSAQPPIRSDHTYTASAA